VSLIWPDSTHTFQGDGERIERRGRDAGEREEERDRERESKGERREGGGVA